ncbi:hypothetical protein JHK82_021451 [Glycine max]|nr:hypothetical protein JHK82_021451 [Glycine max]
MDITAFKSLNIPFPTYFHFPSKFSPFRPFSFFHFKPFRTPSSPRFISHCSLNGSAEITSKEGTLPRGVGEAVNEASSSKILQVVLVSPQTRGLFGYKLEEFSRASLLEVFPVEKLSKALLPLYPNRLFPVEKLKLSKTLLTCIQIVSYFRMLILLPKTLQGMKTILSSVKLIGHRLSESIIPGNTGCIARTCAASAVGLHLVGPLGFQVDDTKLKRAGLDYWPYVVVKIHDSWEDFRNYFRQQEGEKRLLAFTKRGTKIHSEFSYRKGDYLIFGSETSGLPPEALLDCKTEPFGGGTIKIPMVETYVRCLNLSVSVGIALYEASRQLNYESLQVPSESSIDTTEESFIAEDIFA